MPDAPDACNPPRPSPSWQRPPQSSEGFRSAHKPAAVIANVKSLHCCSRVEIISGPGPVTGAGRHVRPNDLISTGGFPVEIDLTTAKWAAPIEEDLGAPLWPGGRGIGRLVHDASLSEDGLAAAASSETPSSAASIARVSFASFGPTVVEKLEIRRPSAPTRYL